MPVSKLAKYKTTFQMVSLSILIISLGFELNDFLWNLGLITLWIAAIITLLSGYKYMAKGLAYLKITIRYFSWIRVKFKKGSEEFDFEKDTSFKTASNILIKSILILRRYLMTQVSNFSNLSEIEDH